MMTSFQRLCRRWKNVQKTRDKESAGQEKRVRVILKEVTKLEKTTESEKESETVS